MISFWVAFLCALVVGAALTLVVRNRALHYGWLDRASSSRKIHRQPIPRLGGVAIVGGFFAPLAALLLVDSSVGLTFRENPRTVWGLFLGGLLIALLGLYDDFKGAGARKKFTVQIAVALALYAFGFRVENIANPFGHTVQLGMLSLPFTCFWVVGVINAMNLIDGLDGLAGGVAFFVVLTNFTLGFVRGDTLMCLFMASLAGAILGFLIFNFNPASIFMGDTGSMFLGFVLATTSIQTSQKSGTAVAMLVPIIALGLPIMDTLLAVARRTAFGRPVFAADKEHIHHRLMSRLRLTHRRAVLFLYGLCCLFALTALGLAYANSAQSAMLLSAVGITVTVLMRKLGYLSLQNAGVATVARRKNVQLRALVREITHSLFQAQTTQAIWEAVQPLADAMEVTRLELRFERPSLEVNATGEGIAYEVRRAAGAGLPLELSHAIETAHGKLGSLSLTWRDGRSEIDRDEELALDVIADAIARAAEPLLLGPAHAAVVLPLRG
jgi:UDP-GlcNAc:undecaprenyl-phosphate GlcNAc-1-phosphate transferase